MYHVQDDEYCKHQDGIEEVKEDFVAHNRTAVSLGVLDNPKGGSNDNESTDGEESENVLRPGQLRQLCFIGWVCAHSPVENVCNDYEAAKEGDLNHET